LQAKEGGDIFLAPLCGAATLYTHLFSPLHTAHDQLTPIPSLLRKEGRARDKVSKMMIKILPFRTGGVSILKQ